MAVAWRCIPVYNERGVLFSETLGWRTKADTGHKSLTSTLTKAIEETRYDAKGKAEFIRYGNQTVTSYTYDPRTFRLVRLTTTRPPSPISKTLPRLMDPGVLQDLSYTYDATGNITEIRDNAYEPAFFNNQQVDAVSRHSYDALYRLIESTGRECSSERCAHAG